MANGGTLDRHETCDSAMMKTAERPRFCQSHVNYEIDGTQ